MSAPLNGPVPLSLYGLAGTVATVARYRDLFVGLGSALLREHPSTRRRLLFVAAHIISDVYLGMVFAMEGGIYWAPQAG